MVPHSVANANFGKQARKGKRMKIFARVGAGLLTVLLASGGAQAATFDSASFGTIPDGDPTGVTRTIDVTQAGTIFDVDLLFDSLSSTYMGDLIVTLVSPGGTVVDLLQRPGYYRSHGPVTAHLASEDLPPMPFLHDPMAISWKAPRAKSRPGPPSRRWRRSPRCRPGGSAADPHRRADRYRRRHPVPNRPGKHRLGSARRPRSLAG